MKNESPEHKSTLIIGASSKPHRASNQLIHLCQQHAIPTFAIGAREDIVAGVRIQKQMFHIDNIHTISLYLNEGNQAKFEDYIIGLKPNRIIFNPGAENRSFFKKASAEGIECIEACSLVMIRLGQY